MSITDSSTDFRNFLYYENRNFKQNEFNPVPYTFRVPDKARKAGENYTLSPPNWLLLDHSIAVIWYLFNSIAPAKGLDIDDLKWAHEFLKEIRNSKGENPADVKACLKEIQDRLIHLYAQMTHTKDDKSRDIMSELGMSLMRKKTSRIESMSLGRSDGIDRMEENLSGNESTLDLTQDELIQDLPAEELERKPSPKEIIVHTEPKRTPQNLPAKTPLVRSRTIDRKTPRRSEIPRLEIPRKATNSEPTQHSEKYFTKVFERKKTSDKTSDKNHEQSSASKKKQSMSVHNNVGRVANSEVKAVCPVEAKTEIQGDQSEEKIYLQFKKSIPSDELSKEQEAYLNLKNEIHKLNKNPKISKKQIMNFLLDWREEQLDRLHNELKRLNSIEDIMKTIKTDGFVPSVENDLVEKLQNVCKKKRINSPS